MDRNGSIVFITQEVDARHPALAATVPKIAALAALSEVRVLAAGADTTALPANARIRLFGGETRAVRGLRFEAALARELARRPRPAAVLAHMCPIYAVLAAAPARAAGVPVLLWYTHWRASRLLRAADRASSVVLSVDRRSFPLPSGKVRAIGHGIDLAEFSCGRASSGDGTLRLLAVGRYSPAKGLEAILRGLRLAVDGGLDATLEVRGPTLSLLEREHRTRLEHVAGELELRERVRLGDAVDRSELPALFAQHDTLVNNMRPGAADKVVYEAGASCLPVLASSPVFDSLLEDRFRFPTDDVAALADRLRGLAALDEAARVEVGRAMHARVAQGHSVEHWAEQVWAAGRR